VFQVQVVGFTLSDGNHGGVLAETLEELVLQMVARKL
jgi:hypothetical protein